MTSRPWILVAPLLLIGAAAGVAPGGAMALSLTSPAFQNGGDIPSTHTCEGKDVSPPLAWSGAPPGTRSLALIVDDPDAPDPKAPKMTWVHWVLYDLPPTSAGLAAAISSKDLPPVRGRA